MNNPNIHAERSGTFALPWVSGGAPVPFRLLRSKSRVAISSSPAILLHAEAASKSPHITKAASAFSIHKIVSWSRAQARRHGALTEWIE